MIFQRILIASDLTSQSAAALRLARDFGAAFGSRVVVAHVIPMPAELKRWSSAIFQSDMKLYEALCGRQIAAAEQTLQRQVSAAGLTSSRGIRCVVRAGSPAPTLAALVSELDADLIIAARGRGGKLGAVAEQLVRLVGRTVMIAPVRPGRAAAIDLSRTPKKTPARPRAAG